MCNNGVVFLILFKVYIYILLYAVVQKDYK